MWWGDCLRLELYRTCVVFRLPILLRYGYLDVMVDLRWHKFWRWYDRSEGVCISHFNGGPLILTLLYVRTVYHYQRLRGPWRPGLPA